MSPVVSGEKSGELGPRYSERHGCARLISTMVTAAILLKSVFRHSGTALHLGSNLDKEIDVGIGR